MTRSTMLSARLVWVAMVRDLAGVQGAELDLILALRHHALATSKVWLAAKYWSTHWAMPSDTTAFFHLGRLVEFDRTDKLFTRPDKKETEDYITGKFG